MRSCVVCCMRLCVVVLVNVGGICPAAAMCAATRGTSLHYYHIQHTASAICNHHNLEQAGKGTTLLCSFDGCQISSIPVTSVQSTRRISRVLHTSCSSSLHFSSMQAARAMMRSTFRAATPLLSQPSSFSTAASRRSSTLVASLSVRRFATGPSFKGHTGPHPTGGEQTPQPNPFQSKPAHETNTQTAVPTTVQSHSSGSGDTANSSHPSGAASHQEVDKYERLPDSEPYPANWVDFQTQPGGGDCHTQLRRAI